LSDSLLDLRNAAKGGDEVCQLRQLCLLARELIGRRTNYLKPSAVGQGFLSKGRPAVAAPTLC
jgi:hypothetical protein